MLRFFLVALTASPALAVAQTLASNDGPTTVTIGARADARIAMATRATTAPVLDGRTDDPAWAQAQVIDQFLEYEPTEGAVPRFKTEARVTYDDKNLYVLVRMYDPAPDSIISLLSRRDVRTQSEQIKLVIDSYNDKRTAYQFCVNPAGVKRDFYVYNDNVEDASWDAVWDVATVVDSVGWVAEFRIPFSQLRFANKPTHTFGLMMVRDIARTNQRISWPLYSRNKQGYVSQSGEIGNIAGIPTPRRLEVSPYVVAKSVTNERENAAGQTTYSHPTLGSYGADIK
ncbi:MAG: carbohydrate binding family 9 domain-containing protein [Gemmatimonadaceae bacterium]